MGMLRKLLPSRGEWVVIAMIAIALGFLLYPAIEERLRYGPAGEMIPSEPPDEAHRIVHASGLSIVAPENWELMHDRPQNPTLTIAARVLPSGGRLISYIEIRKLDSGDEEPDVTGFKQTQFQSYPAFERMVADERTRGASDRRYSTYDLYVDRDGEWWSIRFDIADVLTELPPEIRSYIDTVRFPLPVEP